MFECVASCNNKAPSVDDKMTTREETPCRCQTRRKEMDGCCKACNDEESNDLEELTFSNAAHKQDFLRVIGLQSPYNKQTRLSCTQEEPEELEEEEELEEGECEEASAGDTSMGDSVCSGESENECGDMMSVAGTIYHISEISSVIIQSMTPEERHIYNTLMDQYDPCQ